MSIQIDPEELATAIQARAAQTYAELLDEVCRVTVYARQLERRIKELEAQAQPPTSPEQSG